MRLNGLDNANLSYKFTKDVKTAALKEFTSKWMSMALTKSPTFNFVVKPRPYLVVQQTDVDKIGLKFEEWLSKQKIG